MNSSRLLFFTLAILAGSCAIAAGSKSPPPNIVIFIADDHSQLDSQPYGSTEVRTPNMARLAAEGLTFTHAFVASPACGPSRTALLTGRWPARNGAEPNHRPKRPEVASLPPVLRALGYEVAAIGKVAHNTYAKDHGFDFIEGPNQGFSETTAVARFLATRDPSRPLCLFVGTRHPHVPWSDDRAYDPATVQIPPTHIDTAATREQRASYLTDVTKADTLLGEVRALAREKIPGDTLFIYTADHGAQWPFGKWNLYDAGIRIPLIAVWPGRLKPATTSDALVCWPDLLPTFIELAGGKVPAGLDGRSFAAVLRGTATRHRDRVVATHSGDGDFNVYPIRSVRTRDWKYIRNLHPEFQHHTHISRSSGPSGLLYWKTWLAAAEKDPAAAAIVKRYSERPAEELYDLATDPREQRNLVYPEPGRGAAEPKHTARLASMRADLDAWMKQQGDTQTVVGKPLLHGEPATPIAPAGGKQKAKAAAAPERK
ncbi:MAG: sulfatase [Verrucomicrobia bacterium]|nr:sulfatase [Verrucomicrobiota bacterium]